MHTLLAFSILHSLGAAPPGNGLTYNEAFQHQMIIPRKHAHWPSPRRF